MKSILSVFLYFVSFICFSQKTTIERPDDVIVPDPFKKVFYANHYNYENVFKIATIGKRKYNGMSADTMNVSYYSPSGLKLKEIRYRDNAPNKTTAFSYYPDFSLLSWEMFESTSSTSTKTIYTYHENGQIETTKQFTIRKNNQKLDSTLSAAFNYSYENAHLTEIISKQFSHEQYEYENGALTFKKGGYISKELKYDANGNLTVLNEFMGGLISKDQLMGIKRFNYDEKNRLTRDSILTSSNMPEKKYQVTTYSYQDNGLPQSINVSFGSQYRNMKIEYSDKKIATLWMETNEGNSSYLRAWINHRIPEYYNFPIQYKEVFTYDSFGNKISKKVFVNEELFSEILFEITYRN